MIPPSLIEKFFKNSCTASESQEVAAYLAANPEILEHYLNEREWESFVETETLAPEIAQRLESRIFEGIGIETTMKHRVRFSLMIVAKAACILLLLAAGWLLYHRSTAFKYPVATAEVLTKSSDNDLYQHVYNITSEKMRILLKDGSVVDLFPESEVFYSPNLTGTERAIHLIGKARFNVAQDKSRPFVVYSDELATTALGTSFTVTSFEQENTIKVRLNTGKIVVRSLQPAEVKWPGGKYLAPGDLFIYSKKDRLARVMSPGKFVPGVALRRVHGAALPNWYMFDALSLDLVLDQLALYYGVEIDYVPSDIRKCFFTGKYENKDSLDVILHDIGLLYRLSITQKDKVYRIRKK